MDLVSNKSDKVFDDNLAPLGGVTLFSLKKNRLDKEYTFLQEADTRDWERLAALWYDYKNLKTPMYVRFVNPAHPRFGSIARLQSSSNYSYWGKPKTPTPQEQAQNIADLARRRSFYGELRWDGRNSKPSFFTGSDDMEWLPDYSGPTVWQFDRERNHRVQQTIAYDKLGREISVGDFCTYILYQFDGGGAAGIYFGTVSKIEKNGTVHCKNISLKQGDKVAEKPIKDNKLITILTDDLMRQLMLAKLSGAVA